MDHVDRRRVELVSVPDVVGLTVDAGRAVADGAGVALAAVDLDGPPLGVLTWPGVFVVTAQWPAPGTRVCRWDSVVVRYRSAGGDGDGDAGGGGPAGVREPRRPLPDPGLLRAEAGGPMEATPGRVPTSPGAALGADPGIRRSASDRH